MKLLLIFTLAAVILSLIANRKKTLQGFKMALNLFLNILPSFITVLIAVAFLLAFLPKEVLAKLLGEKSGAFGFVIAALLGSISLIPGDRGLSTFFSASKKRCKLSSYCCVYNNTYDGGDNHIASRIKVFWFQSGFYKKLA